MTKPLILLKHLYKNYVLGGMPIAVLKNICLSINHGELLAIVGTSGSGKSTLMNVIGLLDHWNQGEYFLTGLDVSQLTDEALAQIRNQQIGFVFQLFNLLPRLTAEQNVALPLLYQNKDQVLCRQQSLQALEEVGMGKYAQHKPTQLSGGQQQRVAIARALVVQPQIILADEPTGALDSRTGQEIMSLFQTLHQKGCTVVIVTHDDHIAQLCSRRIRIVDGQIQGGSDQ